ncbi:MAG: hypothetical protein PHO10_10390 [Gemmiger sp.]|nr:hypothetical protein [Gemmiger sp.]
MKRLFKQILKHEIDADTIACLYAACVGWLLALIRYLGGVDGVGLAALTEIMILSWAVAWFQKLLYLRERPAPRFDRLGRGLAWMLVPTVAVGLAAWGFGWLHGCPPWGLWAFILAWMGTLLTWWVCIQLICRDETVEWNAMLTQFKEKEMPNHATTGNSVQSTDENLR